MNIGQQDLRRVEIALHKCRVEDQLRLAIVKQRIGKVKTEASKKSIPLDDVLIEELEAWCRESPYAQDSDYVFASAKMRGMQPYRTSRSCSITSSQ